MRLPGLVTVTVLACATSATFAIDAPASWADNRHRTAPSASPTPAKKTDSTSPWSKGVSEETQDKALALFQQGNVFFAEERYTEAYPFYEKALKLWDHPSIRYNIGVCLIHMRQPLEAYDNLQQSMRYGESALTKTIFTQAKAYQSVLELNLAQVAITVIQPDVKVTLDGKELVTNQGTTTVRTLAGMHHLVATKTGFETEQRAVELAPGKLTPQEVTLKPINERTVILRENYERRWSWWLPWAVVGGGVVAGLVGTGVYVDARSKINDYDRKLSEACPAGCTDDMIPASLAKQARTARRLSQAGIGLWIGAGAAVIAGGALAVINRPRKMEEHRVTPTLTISKDQVGIGVSFVTP